MSDQIRIRLRCALSLAGETHEAGTELALEREAGERLISASAAVEIPAPTAPPASAEDA